MPIFADIMSYEEMDKTARNHYCTCGAILTVAWSAERNSYMLRCGKDLSHNEITKKRKLSEYEEQIWNEIRRAKLEQKTGSQAIALRKYEGATSLSKESAKEIIVTLWPEAETASPSEVFKAMMVCVQYGLNPLMNHLFLIPFKDKDTNKSTYTTVMGIGAKRLIASRKHSYSFVDDTPRIMSIAEEEKIYRTVDNNKIRFITKLKDTQTGATAQGYGEWNREKFYQGKGNPNTPKGTDKGNSMENMAAIRSESQALARLYPADMPSPEIPVIDEAYEKSPPCDVIEGEGRVIEEVEPQEQNALPENTPPPPEPKTAGDKGMGDVIPQVLANGLILDDVKQQLDDVQWADVGKWLSMRFKIPVKKVPEMLEKLTPVQALEFSKALAERKELA